MIFQSNREIVWTGCVETRDGPIAIIVGDGPGPNIQVVNPFQKCWRCTFATQVCELAQKKQKWSSLEHIDHLLEGMGQPIKT